MFRYAVLLAMLLLLVKGADKKESYCVQLSELENVINIDALDDNFNYQGHYFCDPSAPYNLQCKCGILTTCKSMKAQWGQDVGTCSCCPVWLIVVLCICGALILGMIAALVYYFLRGCWFLDGYPSPIRMLIPKRGPVMNAPANSTVPNYLFRGYRSNMFVNGQMVRFKPNAGEEEQSEIDTLGTGINPTPTPTHQRSRNYLFVRTPQAAAAQPANNNNNNVNASNGASNGNNNENGERAAPRFGFGKLPPRPNNNNNNSNNNNNTNNTSGSPPRASDGSTTHSADGTSGENDLRAAVRRRRLQSPVEEPHHSSPPASVGSLLNSSAPSSVSTGARAPRPGRRTFSPQNQRGRSSRSSEGSSGNEREL